MTNQPPVGGPAPIHPLNLVRTFEFGLRLLRFGWRPIYGAAALFLVPAYIVLAAGEAVLLIGFGSWMAEMQRWLLLALPSNTLDRLDLPPMTGVLEFVVGSLILSLVVAVVTIVATAATIDAIGRVYRGEPASAVGAARSALRRILTLTGVYLLILGAVVGIGIVAGLLAVGLFAIGSGPSIFAGIVTIVAAVAVLIFLGLRWAMVQQVIMLDGRPAVGALRQSWHIVAGSTWRVLGYFVFLALTVGLIATALSTLVGQIIGYGTFFGGYDPSAGFVSIDPFAVFLVILFDGLVGLLLLPVTTVILTLLYYDLRWRRGEG